MAFDSGNAYVVALANVGVSVDKMRAFINDNPGDYARMAIAFAPFDVNNAYVREAISRGVSEAALRSFILNNPGDYGRIASAFNMTPSQIVQAPASNPQFAPAPGEIIDTIYRPRLIGSGADGDTTFNVSGMDLHTDPVSSLPAVHPDEDWHPWAPSPVVQSADRKPVSHDDAAPVAAPGTARVLASGGPSLTPILAATSGGGHTLLIVAALVVAFLVWGNK